MPIVTPKPSRTAAIAAVLCFVSSVTNALTYVGTWRVDDGPYFFHGPLAYTGQEAAALLFGGLPSDYLISTMGNNADNIDYKAWYSVIGAGAWKLPQDYDVALPSGQYYDGWDGYDSTWPDNAASAYVKDGAKGWYYRNYAFRIDPVVPESVPLPASLPMAAGGFGLLMLVRRRRRRNGCG
ncbi:MAG: hypothetical protein ACK5JR_19660 [Tropicimonas sp.]|uniref:hypothetical protein n=1 Tax=Tropicimonas sp. TaxID=2067044 RepID=UPI003A88405D